MPKIKQLYRTKGEKEKERKDEVGKKMFSRNKEEKRTENKKDKKKETKSERGREKKKEKEREETEMV
jgi:hypothetical protein